MKTITYYYRGTIEMKSGWRPGYSANGETGGVLYPWMGKRECQIDAAMQQARAVFVGHERERHPCPF